MDEMSVNQHVGGGEMAHVMMNGQYSARLRVGCISMRIKKKKQTVTNTNP